MSLAPLKPAFATVSFLVLIAIWCQIARVHVVAQTPTETWTGVIEMSMAADRSVALITLDREGGYQGDKPGLKPDGRVDWALIIVKPAGEPGQLKGVGALRLPEGRAVVLQSVEVALKPGPRVLFTADIKPPVAASAGVHRVSMCGAIRYSINQTALPDHAAAARGLLEQPSEHMARLEWYGGISCP